MRNACLPISTALCLLAGMAGEAFPDQRETIKDFLKTHKVHAK